MEFDAQFSADDELMAIHDDTLDRTTNGTGHVADHTSDELREIDAAKGYEGWGSNRSRASATSSTKDGTPAGGSSARSRTSPDSVASTRPVRRTRGALRDLRRDGVPTRPLVVICFWADDARRDQEAQRAGRARISSPSRAPRRAVAGCRSRTPTSAGRRLPRQRADHWTPELTARARRRVPRRRNPGARLDDERAGRHRDAVAGTSTGSRPTTPNACTRPRENL